MACRSPAWWGQVTHERVSALAPALRLSLAQQGSSVGRMEAEEVADPSRGSTSWCHCPEQPGITPHNGNEGDNSIFPDRFHKPIPP